MKTKIEVGLRGREYVAPKTESAGIVNQGAILAASGAYTPGATTGNYGTPVDLGDLSQLNP